MRQFALSAKHFFNKHSLLPKLLSDCFVGLVFPFLQILLLSAKFNRCVFILILLGLFMADSINHSLFSGNILHSEISSLCGYSFVFHSFSSNTNNADESQTLSVPQSQHLLLNTLIQITRLSCKCLGDRMCIFLWQVFLNTFMNKFKAHKPLKCNKLLKWMQ